MANFLLDNKDLQYYLDHELLKKIVTLKENNFKDAENDESAPVNYDDALEGYNKVMEIIGEICANTLAPNAEGVDAEGPQVVDDHVVYASGTQENHDMMKQAGLYGLSLPREYGGMNMPLAHFSMASELIGRADAGFSNIYGLQDCAETINEFASEEQKQEYLPRVSKGETCAMDLTEPDAGSDLQAVQLKAHYDEEKGTWILNGVKRFITNGDADISLVLARSEEGTHDGRGLSLFVYDRKHMAVKVRRIEHKFGIIGSPTCELVFTDAPAELVGSRKLGLIRYVMGLMNAARLGIGAQSVGIAEVSYREGLQYAKERKQFGKAIIEFPAVYELLSNMKARICASRAMLYETANNVDMYKTYFHVSKKRKLTPEERAEMKYHTKIADAYTPLLKMMSSEYANSVAYDSLQIHGGSGFMMDYPIQRHVRDARITNIYEGTTQLQVVAAIKGIAAGTYEEKMKEYEGIKCLAMNKPLLERLTNMRKQYEEMVSYVTELDNANEFLDFHARRLAEMAGHIIFAHLMLRRSNTSKVEGDSEEYHTLTNIYLNDGEAKNNGYASYIKSVNVADLDMFRDIKLDK
ncbi:MAG: acyl-CoA dehydrogenase family protein [Bacteroidetes bacterium]|nr:acyl-CoA dehydrogenase family protein [Bacteroidota bacterium]